MKLKEKAIKIIEELDAIVARDTENSGGLPVENDYFYELMTNAILNILKIPSEDDLNLEDIFANNILHGFISRKAWEYEDMLKHAYRMARLQTKVRKYDDKQLQQETKSTYIPHHQRTTNANT